MPGEFMTAIRLQSGIEKVLRHGATILATGGHQAETAAYCMNANERIVSHNELESRISMPGFAEQPVKMVAIIQCAGSREEPRNYCSRTCCVKSLKNAILLKEIHPEAEVYVFYRDIMTYGESERLYTEARGKGVLFLPFDVDNKPEVIVEPDQLAVKGYDHVYDAQVSFKPDLVSLAVGVVPSPADDLARIFDVEITQDGFIKEADSKWRPVDTGKEGVFVCGLARAPAKAEEAMQEGEAAAQRALRILARPVLLPERITARIRYALCSLCEMCVQVCPYGARYIDLEEGQIRVDSAACQGCGVCASVCPNSATVMGDFEDSGIMDVIEAAL
jgi:heterodisulfide reductase subunit A